jgi:predicted DNA-binding transcriptional regulator
MSGDSSEDGQTDLYDTQLRGTTYRVYRYMFREGRPMGVADIQRGLKMSSPSVAQYHIKKLVQFGLIREQQEGYVVDKVVFNNIVRVRRMLIPIQTGYAAFFTTSLLILLILLRPSEITALYFFALIINISSLTICLREAVRTLRQLKKGRTTLQLIV